LATVVLALVSYFLLRHHAIQPVNTEHPTERPDPIPVSAAPVLSSKSIAVLPFANRSPDPENAFFTDGVHEDILTNLGNIRELRVVSNTTVRQYRDTRKSVRQIGTELGVTHILEGSVQRVGNRVRVTAQLIDAGSDAHLWAKNYDKDLSDIFVIQAELAKAIAAELHTVLSPQETMLIERRLTDNPDAYDRFLKAREIFRTADGARRRTEVEELLESAVKLDPKFAEAWLGCTVSVSAKTGARPSAKKPRRRWNAPEPSRRERRKRYEPSARFGTLSNATMTARRNSSTSSCVSSPTIRQRC
jgi:TolB-like protein